MSRHSGYPGPPQMRSKSGEVKRERAPKRKLERREQEFGAPRRYGVGTIMIVTAATAVLLGTLNSLGVPPVAVAIVLVFLFLVGLGQMVLYQGVRPRAASVVAGAIAFPLMLFAINLVAGMIRGGGSGAVAGVAMLINLVVGPVFGAGLGYLAGGVIAGIFLIMDFVEREMKKPLLTRSNRVEPTPEERVETPEESAEAEEIHPLDR